MTWASLSNNGKSSIAFVDSKFDSSRYQEILDANLLPFFSASDVFQQDNAPVHVSISTRKWLAENNINCLSWPSMSPDLNLMENVWGILSRRVYANSKQFDNKKQLISAIQREWNVLSEKEIKNLFDGIPDRIFKCISNKGQIIN